MQTGSDVEAGTNRDERAASRYLDLLKGALLDEHYLENEIRLAYLSECIERDIPPDPVTLRDPGKFLRRELTHLRRQRRTGVPVRAIAGLPMFPYTTIGRTGLDHLQRCLETIRDEGITGDLAACGVWRGGSAIFMRAVLDVCGLDDPAVWVADSFRGLPEPSGQDDEDLDAEKHANVVGDLNAVREGFARFGLLDDRVRFLQGSFAETLADGDIGELALLHVGSDQKQATTEVLERLGDRVVAGGYIAVEHYDSPGCRAAVDAYRARHGVDAAIVRTDWAGMSWRKGSAASVAPSAPGGARARAPLARPVPLATTQLSIVVAFHDMQREAERTLHSLSRAYQQGIGDLDYEVIAVENGSAPGQRLGEELVRSFGPEFRYLDMAGDSTPSPAHAMNRGIEAARGTTLALMIDGAHVLSPGVLRFGMLGLRTFAPAVATTSQWYIGPGQQGEAMEAGYDQDYEDRLFGEIGWPSDGYRLFEIGSFIGERDWFDNHWESNCLFVPRALLEQTGGFDETFSMPGGGYTNLDLFERLTCTPGVTLVDLLGEASFHQLHGGTTTNQPDFEVRASRLTSYREHYEQVRKRPFRNSGKPRRFIGSMTQPAAHTRPRWRTGLAFRGDQRVDSNDRPEHPIPIPDELSSEFVHAYWNSRALHQATWMGWPLTRPAGDLLAYQELVAKVQPDWIIETQAAAGGRAMFLASICDLVGSGRVLSIRRHDRGRLPDHPRIQFVTGNPVQAPTQEQVIETVGEGSKVMLVIAGARRGIVLRLFDAFSPLVSIGSYAVIEDTILNGHPVLPEFGPGPAEAVREILGRHPGFVADSQLERHEISFNPRGFLRRVQ